MNYYIPQWEERTSYGFRRIDPYAKLFEERIIYLGTPISDDVATVGMGLAASMGQFLLCAGTKGKRYALPHARIMMHQPSSGMGGSASDIKIQAQQSLHIKKVLLDLIAEHTGQTVEQVVADADRDRWFPADQAGEYGLVDQVITSARAAADEGRPARKQD